jgi:hypothetical protein
MEVAPLMHQHHHQFHQLQDHQELQPAPQLLRQPSLKKVEYFVEVPAMTQEEVEPAVPKGLGSLAVRRIKRRVARGLGASFNFLSQLDEERSVDENGFTFQYDERVESVVRPGDERRWMLDQSAGNGWTFSFVDCADQDQPQQQNEVGERVDHRLLLSRKASDF